MARAFLLLMTAVGLVVGERDSSCEMSQAPGEAKKESVSL